MFNKNSKMGRNVRAARRLAAIMLTSTLAGTIAAGSAPAVIVSAATWQENADYIFEYLTKRLKYSEAAACGIMANIRCESTFNPHAWNAGGGSYGLCQWTGGRYGRLQSWCGSNGYDYTTIDGQLAYLDFELQNYYPGVENYLRSVENNRDGAYNAGQYYCYHFEAPASRASVSVYRGGLASGTYWESYRPAEWYLVDGAWRYVLRDGSYHKGWLTLDKQTFYLDKEGRRVSGWNTIEGKRYYFDEKGVMVTGWYKVDGRNYYFAKDGSLVTGVVRGDNELYPVDNYGGIQGAAAMEKYAPEWIAREEKRKAELASAEANKEDQAVSNLKDGNKSTLAQAGKDQKVLTQAEESETTPADNLAENAAENTVENTDETADENIHGLTSGGNASNPQDTSDNKNSSGSFSATESGGDKQLASSETDGNTSLASAKKSDPGANLEKDSSTQSSADLQDQENLKTSEEEQVTLAAEAMRAAAESMNEDSPEEPEAQAFVAPGEQEEETIPETAAAAEAEKEKAEKAEDAAASQDDKEKAEDSEAATAAESDKEKAEEPEAATAAQDDEKAETPGDSAKIDTGITAPFASAESETAEEKSASAAEWNIPFGLPGQTSKITCNASESGNNTNAPVYSLPFSYTDATNMLGKEYNDEKESSDSEADPAVSMTGENEQGVPFAGETSDNTDRNTADADEMSDENKAVAEESEENTDENKASSEEEKDENEERDASGDEGSEEEKDRPEESSDDKETDDKDETESDSIEDKDESEAGNTGDNEESEPDSAEDKDQPEAGSTEEQDDSQEDKPEDSENQGDLKQEEDASGSETEESEDETEAGSGQKEDASESETGESEDAAEAESGEEEDGAEDKNDENKPGLEEKSDKDESEEKDESEDKQESGDKGESGEKDEAEDKEESEDKDESEDKAGAEDKDKSEKESGEETEEDLEKNGADEGIRIILKKDIPDISRDEMDDLVEILRKKNILHAVSGNGLNITPKVKASFEQDEDDMYTVTFSVEYNGSEAELESSVRITD